MTGFSLRAISGPVALLGLAAAVAACAGLRRSEGFRGACGTQLERCRATCEHRSNPRAVYECELGCDHAARTCAGRQGDSLIALGELADDERRDATRLTEAAVQRVDLSQGRLDSNGPSVAAEGPVRVVGDAYELMPGGFLKVGFTLPPDARETELHLEHGAGGGGLPCFVTISLGDKPIVARYSAPRRQLDGNLKRETWDATRFLPAPQPEAKDPRAFTLFIYNNAEAQSQAPYFIRRIELGTKQTQAPR